MNVSRETEGPDAICARYGVSRETQLRLEAFAALVRTWTQRINLVSRADVPHIWMRHIADSLQLLPLIPPGCPRAIDLGSGAGFPGMVLAIATNIPFTLIEADQRKCAFLREAARLVGASATILASRIEAAACPPAPLVTARALAPLNNLLGLAYPHLEKGGVCLFPKGASAENEITLALQHWTMRIERHISTLPHSGVILRISEVDIV